MSRTRALAIAAAVGATLMMSACAADLHAQAAAAPTGVTQSAAPTTPPDLPAGISALGTATAIADGTWTLSVSSFSAVRGASKATSVPAGWTALHTKVAFTNTSSEIAALPETALTVRFGPMGRQAVLFTDAGLPGLPSVDEDIQVKPGSTYIAGVGAAVPSQAAGQTSTVTAEWTQQGMAQASASFFEGHLPGTAISASASPGTVTENSALLPLGAWHDGRLRLSPITVGGRDAAGNVRCSLELTVVNDDAQYAPGFGITLRVLTGTSLTVAATIDPTLGYHDAAIAPERTATQTVRFTVPASAVPGPVTVEAVDRDGARTPFDGTLSD